MILVLSGGIIAPLLALTPGTRLGFYEITAQIGPDGIWRVSGDGGNPERIITLESGQRAYGPHLLPDGRTVLFTLARTASWDDAQIVVQSLDNGTRQTLLTGATDGRYVPTGHVVYALRGSILAVPFDARSLSIKGAPVPLVDGVWRSQGALSPAAHFAVSSDGTLAYVPPPSGPVAFADARVG